MTPAHADPFAPLPPDSLYSFFWQLSAADQLGIVFLFVLVVLVLFYFLPAISYATRMQKHFGWVHLIGATLLGLLLGVGLITILPIAESFDECMVRQMRGIPMSMHITAYNICKARNPGVE